MKQKIYQVDAFAEKLFSDNPAAVCPLDQWPEDSLMQQIAMENNLAETAFYVNNGDYYALRWFTPTVEVDLCGHATLAAAFVLWNYEGHSSDEIKFISQRSGELKVKRSGAMMTLNFPTDTLSEIAVSDDIKACFNISPLSAFKGKTDYMLIFNNESEITNIIPHLDQINKLIARGVIITAPGDVCDFVSRFFAPQAGVPEDPVTGSAHTSLTPYWSKQLGKTELSAIQLSARKGYLTCKYLGDRVEISGKAVLYLVGEINVK